MSGGSTSNVFHNGDGCGDITHTFGNSNILQIVNSASNVFHVISGLLIIYRAKSSNIQTCGLCLVITGILSFVYHSTSKSCGFLLDISGMLLWAVSLAYNALCLLHLSAFRCKAASSSIGVFVLSLIHYLMELDYSPIRVWFIWSFHFTAIIVFASAIPLYYGITNKMLNASRVRRVIIAVLTIAFAFLWTQLIHVFCDPNTLNVAYFFPFHSLWHLFAAIAGYMMMTLLDEVNGVIKQHTYKKSDNILFV